MDGAPVEARDLGPEVSIGAGMDPGRRPGPAVGSSPSASGRDDPAVTRRRRASDPSIRRTWWLLAGSFLVLLVIAAARVVLERQALDWLVLGAAVVAAIAAIGHRNVVAGLEARRRTEAESFARILGGLSRSISADAIVAAIMDDLVDGTGADHVAVVRRRADGSALDATLVTGRPGIPTTTTPLPVTDLEGPFGVPTPHPVAVPIAGAEDDSLVAVAARSTTGPAVASSTAGFPTAASGALPEPPTGPGTQRSDARDAARRAGIRLAGEGVALLRDLGLPLPTLGPGLRTPAVAEVLGSGLDAATTERLARRVRSAFGLAQTLAAPIRTEQGLVGAIVLSRRDRAPWTDSTRRLLYGAARETATALARATSLREAETLASTDPLTGLPNRRYFDEFCGLVARRRRSGDAVAALMIDIDHFKRLNERYGHPVGDVVLRRVAQAIATAVRDADVPARVGGEEFAVLLRNPGQTVAAEVGERVRLAVRSLDLAEVGVDGVSVSVGVANARGPDEPIPELVERADQALRRAKRAGRDRVLAAD